MWLHQVVNVSLLKALVFTDISKTYKDWGGSISRNAGNEVPKLHTQCRIPEYSNLRNKQTV
jgi:hypothetical protein